MVFRLFPVFITVLICLNFREVKSLQCGTCCYRGGFYIDTEECRIARDKCDCTAASLKDLLGLVLGVTSFVVIVGIIGCWIINRNIKRIGQNTGGIAPLPVAPGGATYQPSSLEMNANQPGMGQNPQS